MDPDTLPGWEDEEVFAREWQARIASLQRQPPTHYSNQLIDSQNQQQTPLQVHANIWAPASSNKQDTYSSSLRSARSIWAAEDHSQRSHGSISYEYSSGMMMGMASEAGVGTALSQTMATMGHDPTDGDHSIQSLSIVEEAFTGLSLYPYSTHSHNHNSQYEDDKQGESGIRRGGGRNLYPQNTRTAYSNKSHQNHHQQQYRHKINSNKNNMDSLVISHSHSSERGTRSTGGGDRYKGDGLIFPSSSSISSSTIPGLARVTSSSTSATSVSGFLPPPPTTDDDGSYNGSIPAPPPVSARRTQQFSATPPRNSRGNHAPLRDLNTVREQFNEGSETSSQAIRQLLKPPPTLKNRHKTTGSLDAQSLHSATPGTKEVHYEMFQPILPSKPRHVVSSRDDTEYNYSFEDFTEISFEDDDSLDLSQRDTSPVSPQARKDDWLQRMNRRLQEVPEGQLDPFQLPIHAIMNGWAKIKSSHGASMVEMVLSRLQLEYDRGNLLVEPTTKMYTMAVDAWARSGEGGMAAQRAEALLQRMNQLYQKGGNDNLQPTAGIFNAVINAWAKSREKGAAARAEDILNWMERLELPEAKPDKYTFNTVIHAYAKAGGIEAANKARELLARMHELYHQGNFTVKPDTITYNVCINSFAKSGGKGAAKEAEKLLENMHQLYERGDMDVKPNVVTYGAVIDAYAKSGEPGAAARADTLLAQMIEFYQSDPVLHSDLQPNTYVFNTVINCLAKSKERDAASRAEEMLVAMGRLHTSGMTSLKPDAFTYTAVIDAWAKSGARGAAARADQLLDKMETKYYAGDMDLRPNSYTYNAVINALAKSGEAGAAARAERVLNNMVNRNRAGSEDEITPTTINFNTVLDAWAKSGGGRAAAERAEEILEWMDRLYRQGNPDVKPDTITFNAVLDAWARSGDRMAPHRAEQILGHMDDLYSSGNKGVKPDVYTYNTLINCWAKSGEQGSAERAEHVLTVMEKRFSDGDQDFKPNTRTRTSVIDAWAKSGERGAARRAEQILNEMIRTYEVTGDTDARPNVHTANAVCNACAFSKFDGDRSEALEIAFRVFNWLVSQTDMEPDSYTYTIILSVCANLLSRNDTVSRYNHARSFFERCRKDGYVNDYVLRKLRQTVSEDKYQSLVGLSSDASAIDLPKAWTRNAKISAPRMNKGGTRKQTWNNNNSNNIRRRGK